MIVRSVFTLFVLVAPLFLHAQVSQFAVGGDAGAPLNEKITITLQAQNASGEAEPVPNTTCVRVETTSSSGSFFSSASSEEKQSGSIQVTMSKDTSSRTLGYVDTKAGTYTLTFTIAFRPDEVSTSCTSWPAAEWPSGFKATHTVTVGSQSVSPPPSSSSSSNISTSSSGGSGSSSGGEQVFIKRYLSRIEAGDDRMVSVGAAEFFEAEAFDQYGGTLSAIEYTWNFGNGIVQKGKQVFHQYDYSGTYVVTVKANAPRGYIAGDRFVVEANPAELVVSSVTPQYVEISNNSDRDIELSKWSLRAGGGVFQFPEGTTILAGSSVMFPRSATNLSASMNDTALMYPDGRVAYSYTNPPPARVLARAAAALAPVSTNVARVSSAEEDAGAQSVALAVTDELALVSAAAPNEEGNMFLWLSGLATLLLVTIGGLLVVRSRDEPESEATQYQIIDESEEK